MDTYLGSSDTTVKLVKARARDIVHKLDAFQFSLFVWLFKDRNATENTELRNVYNDFFAYHVEIKLSLPTRDRLAGQLSDYFFKENN